MADEKPTPSRPPLKWVRTEQFDEKHANNVRVDSSVWGVSLMFGTLDQGSPDPDLYPPSVKFHTHVSMPWVQAKIMLYHMYMTMMFHDVSETQVVVPDAVLPAKLIDLIPEIKDRSMGPQLLELDAKIRKDLFGE